MIKNISQIENMPEHLKQEVLDFANFLIKKYCLEKKQQPTRKWLEKVDRGSSIGEKASDTVIKMRTGDTQ